MIVRLAVTPRLRPPTGGVDLNWTGLLVRGCVDDPWSAPDWLQRVGVDGCATVDAVDMCDSDDPSLRDAAGRTPADACCRCGAGTLR